MYIYKHEERNEGKKQAKKKYLIGYKSHTIATSTTGFKSSKLLHSLLIGVNDCQYLLLNEDHISGDESVQCIFRSIEVPEGEPERNRCNKSDDCSCDVIPVDMNNWICQSYVAKKVRRKRRSSGAYQTRRGSAERGMSASPKADAMADWNRNTDMTSDLIDLGAFVKAYSSPATEAKISDTAKKRCRSNDVMG